MEDLGDIVGDMRAADRERIGMPDVVIEINREIGGSRAQVADENAALLFDIAQDDLSGG